jgi:trans-aconitate methyltransferase
LSRSHWEAAYAHGDTRRGWYQPRAQTSLDILQQVSSPTDSVVDVGGGASTLVDVLIEAGYDDLTIVDTAAVALEIAKNRVEADGSTVKWVVADLLTWQPNRTFDVWHDRALLHFLLTEDEQQQYRKTLLSATVPGSRAVFGVFGPDGPTSCSGLPVQQFDEELLSKLLGPKFKIARSFTNNHTTPSGASQQFLWATAQRT